MQEILVILALIAITAFCGVFAFKQGYGLYLDIKDRKKKKDKSSQNVEIEKK